MFFLVLFSAALLAAMGLFTIFLRMLAQIIDEIRSMLRRRRRQRLVGEPAGSRGPAAASPIGTGFEGLAARARALALVATDISGRITAWSPGAERLLGFAGEYVRGVMPVEFLFREEELAVLGEIHQNLTGKRARAFDCLVATGRDARAGEMEWSWIGQSGDPIPVRLTITPLSGSSGSPDGYLFLARPAGQAGKREEKEALIPHDEVEVDESDLEPADIVQPILP